MNVGSRLSFALLLIACPMADAWAGEAATDGQPYQWGEEKDGLRMGIRPVLPAPKDSSRPAFEVAAHNVGKEPVVLWLGAMGSNGAIQCTGKVILVLTDRDGKATILEHNGDRLKRSPGRVDPMLVPLAVGCTYSIQVSFENYWLLGRNATPQEWLPRGTYTVVAQFAGEAVPRKDQGHSIIPALPYWKGLLRSGTIQCLSAGQPQQKGGA